MHRGLPVLTEVAVHQEHLARALHHRELELALRARLKAVTDRDQAVLLANLGLKARVNLELKGRITSLVIRLLVTHQE